MAEETSANSCLGSNIILSLDTLLGAVISVHNDIKEIQKNSILVAEAFVNISKIVKHYHDSHLHSAFHESDNLEAPAGGVLIPPVTTPVDNLLREYNSQYDIDGNGMIYGVDFKIVQESAPNQIFEINKLLDSKLKELTLDQYIASIPGNDKIWQR